MTPAETATPYCAELSRQAGEPLEGSATRTDTYLLLECNEAWGEKALEESSLPAEVKAQLKAYQKGHAGAKVLLLHRPGAATEPGIHFFLANTRPGREALYEYRLEATTDLLKMDFDALLASPPEGHHRSAPLFLVCTNGRRDRCCARFGQEVFQTLERASAGAAAPLAWQCSHIGSHRFAANVIALPAGLLYGRVDPASALEILAAERRGELYLPNLRGRSAYPPAAQAAEIFLRRQTGDLRLHSLSLREARQTSPDGWHLEFGPAASGETHRLQVNVEQIPDQIYDGCSLDKRTALVRYTLAEME